MAVVKSKLLKQLSNNYPNFLKRDLSKFTDIILDEIKRALKRGDSVELRGFGRFSIKTQKARISRNPKTNTKVDKLLFLSAWMIKEVFGLAASLCSNFAFRTFSSINEFSI